MADLHVQIGDLRTRITLQSPTAAADAGGAQVPSWANVATKPTVWARWVNAHGQENVQTVAKNVQRATVTVRHRDDIQTTWRILKGTEIWNILSIDRVQGKRRWLEMVVERATGTV